MNAELIAYYVNLLIIQYHTLPRARGHIEAIVDALMTFDIMQAVAGGYDIDTAVGVQLDIIGKYLGAPRTALGVTLTDAEYRTVLRLAIIRNNGNASLKDLDDLAAAVFTVPFIIHDPLTMTLIYIFSDADLSAVLQAQARGLLPSPAAVGISLGITPDLGNIFGYGSYGGPVAGYIVGYGTYADTGTGGMLRYE